MLAAFALSVRKADQALASTQAAQGNSEAAPDHASA